MNLDWKVFLNDDGGGRTYFEWMIQSWGWTLSVAGCAYIVAMVFGGVHIKFLPRWRGWGRRSPPVECL